MALCTVGSPDDNSGKGGVLIERYFNYVDCSGDRTQMLGECKSLKDEQVSKKVSCLT